MKIIPFLIVIFYSLTVGAQERETAMESTDKSVYTYETVMDYKNDFGVYQGEYDGGTWNSWGGNKFHFMKNGKEVKVGMNKFWGFRVGDFVFRMKRANPKIPLGIIKVKEKIFYLEGYLMLSMIRNNGGSASSSRTDEAIFYSDDLEGKIYEISKIIKREKDNPALTEFNKCVKKGKKRYGYQARFNGYYKCVTEF